MVDRRLNKPIYKVGVFPVFWLRAIGADWNCRKCQKVQPKQSVAMEITVRYATSELKGPGTPVKLYLCLACSDAMLQEMTEKVQLCKAQGPEAYKLFTEM